MSAPHAADPSLYRERDVIPVRRALLSAIDKTGIVELATQLNRAGVEIVSTGNTARVIRDAAIDVTDVSELTGFPESLGGRVKTLHPAVHAGLLADLRLEDHERQLSELGIAPFELVISNLYPFADAVAAGAAPLEVVEQIDIGGPAMVRASAKNFANVAVVTSPSRYAEVAEAVIAGGTSLELRTRLARDAFRHTAAYDVAVASWLGNTLAPDDVDGDERGQLPAWIGATWQRKAALRYGENSHQAAALFESPGGNGIAQAEQLGGKEMSYNNYVDADAALRAAYDFESPAVAVVKHANPCGIAVADDLAEAHRKAHECDPQSAFGGVIAANGTVTLAMAQSVKPIFTEVIVAPDYEQEALELLQTKKDLRILKLQPGFSLPVTEYKQLSGGMLLQDADKHFAKASEWTLVAGEPADADTLADLEFAWTACRAVKSNAILLASGQASVGVGMGQVNRVDSCDLAVKRAGDRAAGSVAASDAYFPFPDGPEILIRAGVKAIVQPGGSIRDQLTIDAASAAGVTMYFTGERHFFH
ncbi:bifunctional phosphoribosylaminoimidazolecarboxamide formyltransferase/IMP cyclohydrolase [Humibacter sp.]|jgi:phosphoribosylaminoimidazolecarboxamide formyltransferase/IMP cyclohydrolase|uniref:bifunctional phosphoribosylaminoimidazolecarboxamide formyltransferase/IMP cyclohydrolase n=1 Tax=Humibacter sp. TaxID=1940291 RepID=UPI002CC3CFC2|nr:bifunctional phosphoribosylaminoimidazolecarboxamide formyltransferase/IMP cyclohydrolase [Humibacter sp.]HVX06518.1 bifunctional phosphoribosylaminoimidazolecarboxamide formyltransferase/IMP cyclohydrolase [Humibacter sp.]